MKLALIGYGKMGREIEKIATERGHDIVLKITSENTDEMIPQNLANADAAIEFSKPESAVRNIKNCFRSCLPVVVGTTGWYADMDEVKKAQKEQNGSLLYATNFSIGVNIFFAMNRQLARLMDANGDYEVKVEETHHTQKLDAPSGTAITIAEGIIDNLNRKNSWVNEESENDDELSVISHRIENVPGTHEVSYSSDIDDIEIKHTAHNRKGFALGAVVAAEWLYNKTGIFSMKDVLDID